jgi:hypothetical protein
MEGHSLKIIVTAINKIINTTQKSTLHLSVITYNSSLQLKRPSLHLVTGNTKQLPTSPVLKRTAAHVFSNFPSLAGGEVFRKVTHI